jgi:hypothetical protein
MIYVIAPEQSTIVKIGHTTLEPVRRVAGLQTGNPERLVLRWSGEGDEKLEKHLHVVFADYRVQGEWFDLEPLGDPVQAVKSEVSKAHQLLARGEALLAATEPYRYPVQRSVWTQPSEDTEEVIWDPEVPASMRRGLVYFPAPRPRQTWDERFEFPVSDFSVPKDRILGRSPNGHDPKPGCIRVWKGRCQRPAGTTCEGC